jgi:hypothetical protein
MDTTALNPFFAQLHTAAQNTLTLQREAGELFLAQAKVAETQAHASFEGARSLFAAQQHAVAAMGQVFVDALKPAAAKA